VTESVGEYFGGLPRPSGSLDAAIISYGASLIETCRTSGTLQWPCAYPDKTLWCDITTALPPSLLPAYSTYASNASSWWSVHSSAAVRIAQECPVLWYGASDHVTGGNYKINQTMIHAECYADADPFNAGALPMTTATSATPGITSSLAASTSVSTTS
jgi:hypothetical protein